MTFQCSGFFPLQFDCRGAEILSLQKVNSLIFRGTFRFGMCVIVVSMCANVRDSDSKSFVAFIHIFLSFGR